MSHRVVAGSGAFRLYFRHYLTSDGLISVAGLSPSLIKKFHDITGLAFPDLSDPTTPDFQAIVGQAEALFGSRSSADWLTTLRENGYPCMRYNLPYQAIVDPQVEANDFVVDLEHESFGGYRTIGMPFRFSATPARVTSPSPRLGQHTNEVLERVGLDSAAIAALRDSGVVA